MTSRSASALVACAALAAALVAGAAPAAATVKRFYPMQFLEKQSAQNSFRSPANIGAPVGGQGEFWAPLSLPAGAVITGLTYWHSGGGPGTRQTRVSIAFKGSEGVQYDPRFIADAESTAGTSFPATVAVPGAMNPLAPPKIVAGWRYWVDAYCEDGGAIWEVDVFYKLP